MLSRSASVHGPLNRFLNGQNKESKWNAYDKWFLVKRIQNEGIKQVEAVKLYGVHESTLSKWFKSARSGNVEFSYPGRPKLLSDKQIKDLAEKIKERGVKLTANDLTNFAKMSMRK
jgi:transposase